MPTHRMTTPIFSAEYWALKNPVLLKGERGLAEFYDEDGHVTRIREKVGDGVMGADRVITGTHWNDLPWIITGEQGPKGDTGPMPQHDWSGTALRFENPDGSWGNRVDLKGEPGNRVNAEPATTTTLGGVMPATGLRTDMEGHEYVALGWDKHGCYPDPIIVEHTGSAWLWLKKSGVGTEAGVREPGTEDAKEYWRKIANSMDIPGPGKGLELNAENNTYNVKYGRDVGTALEGNGTALAAEKLYTPRNLITDLGSDKAVSFNGTQDIKPGVSGILPLQNGGTGTDNLQALATQLQGTGVFGGVARLVGEFYFHPHLLDISISGLNPGHLLLWIPLGFQNNNPDANGSLPLMALGQIPGSRDNGNNPPSTGLLTGLTGANRYTTDSVVFSVVGMAHEDDYKKFIFTPKNMDMAIILEPTVNVRAHRLGQAWPMYIRFYEL